MKQLNFIAVMGFLCLISNAGNSHENGPIKSTVSPDRQVDQLFTAWNNPETPGAAVAVVKDGKIIYKKGFGSANLEYNIPVSPATVFHVASVSKQFTAFSILLLAREGRLSLDDDIRKYLPEVPDFGKVITLRQLVHHTSGLRDQWNLLAMAGWRLDDVITKDQIMRIVHNQKELNFVPGNEFMYCNTGFTLLAEVVARVSGQSFADYTRDHIFKPLKMLNTLFYDDHEKIVKNRAYSFYPDGNGFKKSVLSYANAGATSLFTTAEDLSLWAMNFENPVVGGKDIVALMEERGVLNNGDTISYALGQDIGRYRGLKFISHGGADAGYRAFLGRFPDQKLSVVVLSNNGLFNPAGLALKIADIYLKDKLAKDNPKEVSEPPKPENKTVPADITLLKSYCGKYELQPGMLVTIDLNDNQLVAGAPGISRISLIQVSANEFAAKGMDARLTFPKDNDGQITKMIVVLNGQESTARKIKESDIKDLDLSEFEGVFYSPELCTSYSFVLENGKLIARHFRLGDLAMTPVKADSFTADQWFFNRIEFIRDDQNQIKGCRVSSDRVRNLWFDKIKQ